MKANKIWCFFLIQKKKKKKSEFFWDRIMVEWRNKSKQSRTRYLTWNSGLFSYKIFCCKQNWQSDMTYIRTNSPDGKPIQTPTKKLKHINPIHKLNTSAEFLWPQLLSILPFPWSDKYIQRLNAQMDDSLKFLQHCQRWMLSQVLKL